MQDIIEPTNNIQQLNIAMHQQAELDDDPDLAYLGFNSNSDTESKPDEDSDMGLEPLDIHSEPAASSKERTLQDPYAVEGEEELKYVKDSSEGILPRIIRYHPVYLATKFNPLALSIKAIKANIIRRRQVEADAKADAEKWEDKYVPKDAPIDPDTGEPITIGANATFEDKVKLTKVVGPIQAKLLNGEPPEKGLIEVTSPVDFLIPGGFVSTKLAGRAGLTIFGAGALPEYFATIAAEELGETHPVAGFLTSIAAGIGAGTIAQRTLKGTKILNNAHVADAVAEFNKTVEATKFKLVDQHTKVFNQRYGLEEPIPHASRKVVSGTEQGPMPLHQDGPTPITVEPEVKGPITVDPEIKGSISKAGQRQTEVLTEESLAKSGEAPTPNIVKNQARVALERRVQAAIEEVKVTVPRVADNVAPVADNVAPDNLVMLPHQQIEVNAINQFAKAIETPGPAPIKPVVRAQAFTDAPSLPINSSVKSREAIKVAKNKWFGPTIATREPGEHHFAFIKQELELHNTQVDGPGHEGKFGKKHKGIYGDDYQRSYSIRLIKNHTAAAHKIVYELAKAKTGAVGEKLDKAFGQELNIRRTTGQLGYYYINDLTAAVELATKKAGIEADSPKYRELIQKIDDQLFHDYTLGAKDEADLILKHGVVPGGIKNSYIKGYEDIRYFEPPVGGSVIVKTKIPDTGQPITPLQRRSKNGSGIQTLTFKARPWDAADHVVIHDGPTFSMSWELGTVPPHAVQVPLRPSPTKSLFDYAAIKSPADAKDAIVKHWEDTVKLKKTKLKNGHYRLEEAEPFKYDSFYMKDNKKIPIRRLKEEEIHEAGKLLGWKDNMLQPISSFNTRDKGPVSWMKGHPFMEDDQAGQLALQKLSDKYYARKLAKAPEEELAAIRAEITKTSDELKAINRAKKSDISLEGWAKNYSLTKEEIIQLVERRRNDNIVNPTYWKMLDDKNEEMISLINKKAPSAQIDIIGAELQKANYKMSNSAWQGYHKQIETFIRNHPRAKKTAANLSTIQNRWKGGVLDGAGTIDHDISDKMLYDFMDRLTIFRNDIATEIRNHMGTKTERHAKRIMLYAQDILGETNNIEMLNAANRGSARLKYAKAFSVNNYYYDADNWELAVQNMAKREGIPVDEAERILVEQASNSPKFADDILTQAKKENLDLDDESVELAEDANFQAEKQWEETSSLANTIISEDEVPDVKAQALMRGDEIETPIDLAMERSMAKIEDAFDSDLFSPLYMSSITHTTPSLNLLGLNSLDDLMYVVSTPIRKSAEFPEGMLAHIPKINLEADLGIVPTKQITEDYAKQLSIVALDIQHQMDTLAANIIDRGEDFILGGLAFEKAALIESMVLRMLSHKSPTPSQIVKLSKLDFSSFRQAMPDGAFKLNLPAGIKRVGEAVIDTFGVTYDEADNVLSSSYRQTREFADMYLSLPDSAAKGKWLHQRAELEDILKIKELRSDLNARRTDMVRKLKQMCK